MNSHPLSLATVAAYQIGEHQVRGLAAVQDFGPAYVSRPATRSLPEGPFLTFRKTKLCRRCLRRSCANLRRGVTERKKFLLRLNDSVSIRRYNQSTSRLGLR